MSREERLSAAAAYDGQPHVIAAARGFTAAFLRQAAAGGLEVTERLSADAQLVVSELVTNAVRHAPGRCTLTLDFRRGRLDIAVSDTSVQLPAAQPFGPERIGRHGLEIVLALCTGYSTQVTDTGKTVRAGILVV